MTVCGDCGGTVIEYDQAAGNGFCVGCGTVVEENVIVNEIAFGETSNGAAMVQGSFVAQGATHARMSGPYGNRGSNESREQTIANANRKIQSIANVLKLSEVVCLAATRLYTLAVEHKFTKGRKSINVVAVCLYVACRQKETKTYMLIDFSDLLQVNVFELGHTYLQLVQTLNLRLPLVDPSHYISRFAALLEFGDETHKVATDAVRLVQRFDRDWMTRGRRPAGICGAALLLAARMNNFRRSVEEIVQVVKIADTTLKKRLDEFRATPSGSLTLADFRNVWLEDEMDPPAFIKGKEKEEAERVAKEREASGEVEEDIASKKKGKGKGKGKKAGKSRKGKRKRDEEDEEEQGETKRLFDPGLLADGILAGALDGIVPVAGPPPGIDLRNIDPVLLQQPYPIPPPHSQIPLDTQFSSTLVPPSSPGSTLVAPSSIPVSTQADEVVSSVLAEEVETFLHTSQGTLLSRALDEAEERRLAAINASDDLAGLDEDELDGFILNPEEVRIKERVWVEINREYLEALAAKGDQTDSQTTKSRKRRKTNNKPRDASTAAGGTTAESVRNLIKKNPKYSKRINYDALKDLFVDSGSSPALGNSNGKSILRNPGYSYDDDEKQDGDHDDGAPELYTFGDDKDEPGVEGVVIIEEGEASVVGKPVLGGELEDGDGEESEDENENEKEEVWEEGYEQEAW